MKTVYKLLLAGLLLAGLMGCAYDPYMDPFNADHDYGYYGYNAPPAPPVYRYDYDYNNRWAPGDWGPDRAWEQGRWENRDWDRDTGRWSSWESEHWRD